MNTLKNFQRNRDENKGFTLIELMIAIAIVGVLAAIAVPTFSNYLARARISEAINYAQGCKTGYLEFYATSGVIPTGNGQANCESITTDNIASIVITSTAGVAGAPAIRMRLVNAAPLPVEIRDHTIVLQPLNPGGTSLVNGQRIESWRCALTTAAGAAAAPAALELVPAICRNAVLP